VLTRTKVWITLRAGLSGVLTRTKVWITLRAGLSGVLTRTKVWKKITSWNVWCANAHERLGKLYKLGSQVC
jgi:tagatose-1,6-bisphosphate aldolase